MKRCGRSGHITQAPSGCGDDVRYLGRSKRRYLNKREFLRVWVVSATNTEEESAITLKAIRAQRARISEN